MTRYHRNIRLSLRLLILFTLIAFVPATTNVYGKWAAIGRDGVNYDLYEPNVITIQFAAHTKMRLRDGVPQNLGAELSSAEAEEVRSFATSGSWSRSHTVNELKLEKIWQTAQANSADPLPDPNNRFRLRLPDGVDAATAVEQYSRLSSVEAAYLVPKPVILPSTLDYSKPGNDTGNEVTDPYQGYLDAAPNGVDARWAWRGMGGRGDGMRICDVEYNYNPDHADLPNVTYLGEPMDSPFGQPDRDHGTAVLGEMGGRHNGVGVKGIAYQALYYFAAAKTTTGGYDVGAGVLECVAALTPGDVILIEQQTAGPNATGVGQAGLVPVEWQKPWYDDIKTAVAAGMIVVEAAGNGGENLDDPEYSTGNNGHYPFLAQNDSGAIIVGSANPPSSGALARSRRSSSTYGSTVDLQGWGTAIVTSGYGNLFPGSANLSQENEWYTRSFGGTSGASPMVAASAAIVQRTWELTHGGTPASPAQIKQILRDTGTPQTGTDNIGPFPNLRAALLQLLGNTVPTVAPPIITPAQGVYPMPHNVNFDYGPGTNTDDTIIKYTIDGSEPTIDSASYTGFPVTLLTGGAVKAKSFQFHPATQRLYESTTVTVIYLSGGTGSTPGDSTPKVEKPIISPGAGSYNQPHLVTITTNTPGATIRYRTDGRAPSFFYPGTVYTGSITLTEGEYEIAARGYKDGYYKSDVAYSGDISVNPVTLPAPTIYPNGGNFNGSVTVYIGSTVLGADIRYTVDGTEPTESSPEFVEPLALTANATVKARVYLDGYGPSQVKAVTFNVTQQAETPTINPNGGEFTDSVEISMSTASAGATIRYTTNGAEPTGYSSVYTAPFTLGVGQHTVKAKAFLTGANPSGTASADFTVYTPLVGKAEAPIFDPNGGNHTEVVTMTMRTDTEGATIRYTFDPLSNENTWTEYTAPLVLTANPDAYVIRAKAYKTGMADSDLTQTSFNVFEPVGTIEPPDITPAGGTYDNEVQVTVDGHTNPPFKIRQLHITTDGTDPMPSSNTDSGVSSPKSLTISESTTVKALASQLGWYNSDIVVRDYILQCAKPEIALVDAPPDAKTVTITTNTTGATIRYTTDGSEVTEASPEYTAPFDVGVGTTVVNAKCFRSGFSDSLLKTEVILVEEQVAPAILQQPQGMTVDAGTDISFTVQASGVPSPTIRWQFKEADIAGETEPQLDLPSVQSANAGDYRAIIVNEAGVVTSTVAVLAVNGAAVSGLSIDSSSPTPLGNPMYFSASVDTGSDVSYAWDFGENVMAASINSGASISHTYTMQGTYTVSVTASNNINSLTETVQVQVVEPLATATPTPSNTPNPSATETPIPSGTPDPSETPSGTPVATGTPQATPTQTSNGGDQKLYLPLVER